MALIYLCVTQLQEVGIKVISHFILSVFQLYLKFSGIIHVAC